MFYKLCILFAFCISFEKTCAQCTLKKHNSAFSTLLKTCGNKQIDNLVIIEKNNLEKVFGVIVDLNICSGSNGQAINNCRKPNCNGTIELGKDLLNFEFNRLNESYSLDKKNIKSGEWVIITILAHEFAHILQYAHPDIKWKSTLEQEVHADFLAGWYIQKIIQERVSCESWDLTCLTYISHITTDILIKFGWLGDTEYGSQQHHGNYDTRGLAVHAGISNYERGFKRLDEVFFYGINEIDMIIKEFDFN